MGGGGPGAAWPKLHRLFVEAGSDLLLTCSFGASSLRLADEALHGRAVEVNTRAAEIAREVAGPERLVAGSIGPTGHLTDPLGPLTHELAVSTFAEQAGALAAAGVDLLVLETLFSLDEGLWALEGIRRVTDVPVVVSYSFDQGTRTMMGLSPTDVVRAFAPLGVAAIGANCGKSLADTDRIVEELLAEAGDLPLWVKPNAGVPRIEGERVVYEAGPDDLARHVTGYVEAGRQSGRRLLWIDARARRRDRGRARGVAEFKCRRWESNPHSPKGTGF